MAILLDRKNHPMRNITIALVLILLFATLPAMSAFPAGNVPPATDLAGSVTDPEGAAVPKASVTLLALDREAASITATDEQGHYEFHGVLRGKYTLRVAIPGFDEVDWPVIVRDAEPLAVDVQLKLAATNQEVKVSTDVLDVDVASPDPAQRVVIREETLDANPGRPGAPVSIPGLPIETASGGIKAPQYFAPGVAGDHGESIASYIQVGSYLVSNNLSANAHGNGYADPNILVPEDIGSVQVDGGAFNVREGNHSQNLSAIYAIRPTLEPFATLTGDYRDGDVATGFNPFGANARGWVALEASYGNGFLDRLEHRR